MNEDVTENPAQNYEALPDDDSAADTAMFRAFVERREPAVSDSRPAESGRSFRLFTLLGGLVVFALLVLVLLR